VPNLFGNGAASLPAEPAKNKSIMLLAIDFFSVLFKIYNEVI
jgi:hypothetical protein